MALACIEIASTHTTVILDCSFVAVQMRPKEELLGLFCRGERDLEVVGEHAWTEACVLFKAAGLNTPADAAVGLKCLRRPGTTPKETS